MSTYQGFGELKSPADLVEKLRHDLERLENSPHNQYAAFDFFVTAEHIPGWIYPNNWADRKKHKSSVPLLRITSHIANGAKHFEATERRHASVTDIEKERYVEAGYVEEDYFEDSILIHLTSEEAKAIGTQIIDAKLLASRVLQYWEDYFIAEAKDKMV
ncbi:MAG: hypothetical protein L0H37_04930 [Nitrosospira sp.]|nr:hypothetical protein [Nitrosospira sp.]